MKETLQSIKRIAEMIVAIASTLLGYFLIF